MLKEENRIDGLNRKEEKMSTNVKIVLWIVGIGMVGLIGIPFIAYKLFDTPILSFS